MLLVYSNPLIIITFVMFGAFILFDPVVFGKLLPPPFKEEPKLFGLLFIGFPLFLLLFNYLQGEHWRSDSRSKISEMSYTSEQQDYITDRNAQRIAELLVEQRDAFEKDLASIRNAVEKGAKSQVIELSAAEKLKLVDDVSKSIETTLSHSFLKAVDSKYSLEGVQAAQRRLLLEDVDRVRLRLISEVDALRRRANSNLAIGSLTTMLAMGSLAYVALARDVIFDSSAHVLSYYVPRISFVVFIEVFAYFFLRLYKTCLSDIKFYQNELTTMESKALALKSALAEGKAEALKAGFSSSSQRLSEILY